MRVLHVVTRMNVGGVAELLLVLAEALPATGVEVVLATGDVQEGEREVEHLPPGAVRVAGLGRSPRAGDDLRALRAVRRLIKDVRPDVLHTHTAKAGALGRVAAEGLRLPRVHTFHGHLLHGYFGPAVTRAVTLTEAALARRTDLLISSGRRVGEELRAAGVGRGREWLDVPPGIRAPRPSGTRDGRTVAFVGRLVPVKRPELMLEVARRLPDVRILVAGDGPLRPTLEAEAPPNVDFLGWVSDVGEVYGRASAVLLTSANEAMPLALIEGALCGLPGVTTDAGSAAEVVDDGRTGRVVSDDPDEIAGSLRALLDDEEHRRATGLAALTEAEARFTPAAMARAHADAYRRLVHG